MKKSLSIIFPVHNVQSRIAGAVDRLLETVAELTSDFEILIIDDGSTDATEEVLYEITCQYPQVRTRRYTPKQGKATAIDLGVASAMGEVVMIHDLDHPLTTDDIRSLWAMHVDTLQAQQGRPVREVMQRTTPFLPSDPEPLGDDLLNRLANWGADVSQLREAAAQAKSKQDQRQDDVREPKVRLRMPQFLQRLREFAVEE